MFLLLFQGGAPGAPLVSLGPYGTVALTIVTAVLAILAYRQRTWKSTADAATVELGLQKQITERLRTENAELKLKAAQTDLQPLNAALASWILEGRERFAQADRSLQANTEALRGLLTEVKAQRATSEESYRNLQAAFIAHTLDDKAAQLDALVARTRLASVLEALEAKLGIITTAHEA